MLSHSEVFIRIGSGWDIHSTICGRLSQIVDWTNSLTFVISSSVVTLYGIWANLSALSKRWAENKVINVEFDAITLQIWSDLLTRLKGLVVRTKLYITIGTKILVHNEVVPELIALTTGPGRLARRCEYGFDYGPTTETISREAPYWKFKITVLLSSRNILWYIFIYTTLLI